MHIARIGIDGDLNGKHPDDSVRRDRTEMKPELSARIPNRKPLYPFIRDSPKEKKGRLWSIRRKAHILTRRDATLTHTAGGKM